MVKVKIMVEGENKTKGFRFITFNTLEMWDDSNKEVVAVTLTTLNGDTLSIKDDSTSLTFNGKVEKVMQYHVCDATYFATGEIKRVAVALANQYMKD